MTHLVVNELFVESGDVEEFERNFVASMKGTLAAVDGLVHARLVAPRTEGRGYLSVLEFVDHAAYARYLESEAFAAAHMWPDHAPFSHNQLAEFETRFELGG